MDKVDTRNVQNKYKWWETDLIKKDCVNRTLPYAVFMNNLSYDINLATVIRNANLLGAEKVYYRAPKKKYDPRGCVGAQYYTNVEFIETLDQLKELKFKYEFVAVEIVNDAIPIYEFKWPRNTLMLFGAECESLPQEILDLCDHKVYIPMYGAIRSFNTGCATAIAMNEYVRNY